MKSVVLSELIETVPEWQKRVFVKIAGIVHILNKRCAAENISVAILTFSYEN